MGTIKMKIFAMILMLVFIWIKPITATNQLDNHKKRSFCDIFKICNRSKKNNVIIIQKNQDFSDREKVINKNKDVSDFEKLKHPIMHIIMSFLDIDVYVKMTQLNKLLFDYIKTRVEVNHFFTQYTTFLIQYPITKEDAEMFRQYAISLGALSVSLDLDVKPCLLLSMPVPVLSDVDKQVPRVILFKKQLGEEEITEFMTQIHQWEYVKCDYINLDHWQLTSIFFCLPDKTQTSLLEFTYRRNKRLPYYVRIKYVPCDFQLQTHYHGLDESKNTTLSQRGYYQEAHFTENDGDIMLFYSPTPKNRFSQIDYQDDGIYIII